MTKYQVKSETAGTAGIGAIQTASEIEIARLQSRLDEVYGSTSWKVAREVARPFERFKRLITREARVLDARLEELQGSSKLAREVLRPLRRVSRPLSGKPR